MAKELEILEDYLEGYRAWRVVGNRLYSLLKAGEYPRGVAVAECNSVNLHTTNINHESPEKTCTCGLYASWDANKVSTDELIGVSGKVKGWGKSFLASGGWRSQYQMIEYLYKPLCQGCCANYRHGISDPDEIFNATRKLKFSVEYHIQYEDKSEEHSFLPMDEFLCKTHLKEISDGNSSLIEMMLLSPQSTFKLSVDNISVKKVVTDTKYMKELKDLSNYYEVDFKEFNNENN